MKSARTNATEWSNPDNWTGRKWISVYFSKRDSRLWVPKRVRRLGWTINLGHPKGAAVLTAILFGIIALVALINFLTRAF